MGGLFWRVATPNKRLVSASCAVEWKKSMRVAAETLASVRGEAAEQLATKPWRGGKPERGTDFSSEISVRSRSETGESLNDIPGVFRARKNTRSVSETLRGRKPHEGHVSLGWRPPLVQSPEGPKRSG